MLFTLFMKNFYFFGYFLLIQIFFKPNSVYKIQFFLGVLQLLYNNSNLLLLALHYDNINNLHIPYKCSLTSFSQS